MNVLEEELLQKGILEGHLQPEAEGGADKYFPISRTFGSASPAGSLDPNKPAGSWQASNGVIFANALGWLIERAHFNGVDRSP